MTSKWDFEMAISAPSYIIEFVHPDQLEYFCYTASIEKTILDNKKFHCTPEASAISSLEKVNGGPSRSPYIDAKPIIEKDNDSIQFNFKTPLDFKMFDGRYKFSIYISLVATAQERSDGGSVGPVSWRSRGQVVFEVRHRGD